jgi:hypothetical protein
VKFDGLGVGVSYSCFDGRRFKTIVIARRAVHHVDARVCE